MNGLTITIEEKKRELKEMLDHRNKTFLELIRSGMTMSAIAKEYGISVTTVSAVLKRMWWRDRVSIKEKISFEEWLYMRK